MPLTDAQYEALADKYLISLYQELERDVIQDIARRVKKTTRLTETAELMAKHMREQGYPTDKIYSAVMKSLMADDAYQKEVAENTKAHKADIREKIKETMDQMGDAVKDMTQEVAEMSWNTDLSMWKQAGQDLSKPNQMSQLVAAASANTKKTLRNLTNTTGFKGTQLGTVGVTNAYQRVLDLALLKVATGTFSYDEACNDAVKKLAQSGLRTIDYKSGRSYQLDTAVRMCVRTANHQLSGKVSEANCKATGQDLVITSQHIGARPEHVEVQNKVFSLSGKSKKYPCFSDPMPSEGGTGAGYGSVNGIMGVNCRHAFYPFFEGISEIPEDLKEPEPVTIDGKEYTYYEATQKQRAMERDIRALKREAYATDDPEEAGALRRQAAAKSAEYLDFSRKAGIRAKENRLRVVDETHVLNKPSDTVMNRAKRIKDIEGLKNISNSSIINLQVYSDVVAYFKDHLGITVSGLEKKDLFKVKTVLAGYDDFINDFPMVKDKLKTISYNYRLRKYGNYNRSSRVSEIGPDGVGDYGTGVHEAAHVLDVLNSKPLQNDFAEAIVEQARKNLGYRENSRKYIELRIKLTGDPSETRPFEIFAFGLETYYGGPENELAKEIYNCTKEALYGFKDVNA